MYWAASEADGTGGLLGELVAELDAAVFGFDESGAMALWNDRFAAVIGADRDAIAELAPEDLLRSGAGPDADGSVADWSGEVALLDADGEALAYRCRLTTVTDPETGAVYRCGIARDASDRLARQRELERYEHIVETVSDGVYALDESMSFEYVNDGLCEMLGYDREELLGVDPPALFAAETGRELAADMRERVLTGDRGLGVLEGEIELADGSTRELEARYRLRGELVDGGFPGSVGVIRDISQRKRRERTLARQRDELETLNRIAELLLEITRELVETSSRRTLERTVCDRLAGSDLYRFAAVLEP
ncbi:MAG: PAS domain-containing protein [Haloarculaceae archaeon]